MTTYATQLAAITRTPVSLLVLDLDRCTRTFGTSPCLAAGTKCYNTRGTCKYPTAYVATPTSYKFTSAAAPAVIDGARPYLKSISRNPTEIKTTLTVNGRATVTLYDEPDGDIGIDPYLSTRTSVQGTFWKKLLARNPHTKGRPARIYDGFDGMSEAEFLAQQSWVGTIDAITLSRGEVKIEIVDLLKALDQVQIPEKLDIKLLLDVDASVASMTLTTTTGLDATNGYVRIGDEVIGYATIDAPTNRILTCTRGAFETVADTHTANDKVQRCRYYPPDNPFDVLLEMLTVDAAVDAGFIDAAAFAAEKASPGGEINISALVTEPTTLDTLYFEIVDLLDCKSWVGEDLKITIRRNLPNIPGRTYATLTDVANIVDRSGAVDLNPTSRLSRFLLYWDKTAIGDDEKPASYARLDMAIDADAESAAEYGVVAEKLLYCRWLKPGLAIPEIVQEDFLRDFTMRRVWNQRDPLPIIKVDVEKQDAGIRTGQYVRLTTDELQARDGTDLTDATCEVIRRQENDAKSTITLTLLRVNPRRVCFIAPGGAPDYDVATTAEREYGYICDDPAHEIEGDPAYHTW